jgi:ankyrin repeat protein
VIKYLIGFEANLNVKDNSGKTPLHLAVESYNNKTT